MFVVGVVPGEKRSEVRLGGGAVVEAGGITRMVFEGLEEGLTKRVVVADSETTMGLRNPETPQQLGQKLAGHDAAAVGMERQMPWPKLLPLRAGFDQLAGQRRGLRGCHHPAHHVAAIHVLNGIQVDVATACQWPAPGVCPRARASCVEVS